MEKKIYVVGLDNGQIETAINNAVSAVAGVSSCAANAAKAQVCVVFDESVGGVEDAVNAAVTSCGVEILN